MKNIIANIVRGRVQTYLAAAFAALATSSAWAATVSNWKSTSVGGSEESPYDIWAAANWDNGVGSGKHLNFDVSSLTYMTNTASITTRVGDDFRVNSGDFVFLGPIYCSNWSNNTANARVSVLKKGDWKVEGYDMVIGSAKGSTVAFTNETGNVEINGSNLVIANGNGATASVVTKAGTWNVTGNIILAGKSTSGAATMTVEGGRVTAGGYLSVGKDGPSGGQVIVKSGATFTTGDKLVVAWHSKGELDIDGGEFDVGTTAHLCYSGYCKSSESEYGRIYIRNGGRLSASSLQYAGAAGIAPTAPATITLDGGTLKAKAEGTLIQAHNNLTVTVGANGGTIDNGGFDIKIPAAISGSGWLVVKGGGSLTLSSDTITYNSKTILEAGTLLAVSNNTAAANILANGIELIGTPALNTDYTVFVCNKELTASDLDKVTCATAEITKSIGADGKSIVVRFTAFKEFAPRYIGPENGSLSDAANWSPAVVPTSGNAYIPTETAANLTVGDTFSPSAITFLPGSAAVTISGTDLADIEAVTNLSFAVQTFANSVAFKDAYRVCCDRCAVNFAGGATATCPAGDMVDNVASHMLMGNITFTNDWNCDYTLSKPYSVPNGSSLYGKSLTGTRTQIVLSVDVGGYAEFADNVYTGSKCGRVHVYGEMVVKGRWIMKGTNSYAHVGFDGDSAGNGILRANGIWKGDENNNMTRVCYIKPPHIYIGSDGLGAKSNDYAIHFDEGAHTVYATDNFEIFGNANDRYPWDWGIAIDQPVTFNTQGYTINWTAGADGTGALVKDGDGTLIFNPYGTRLSGAVTVKGGTLKVMSASGVSTGATTVKDSAILELASGATLGSSAVTLESGSTLALTATSSTFTALANTVNLPTGENEKATIRIDGQRLKTGDHPILSGVAADAADHVELDMTSAALDGRKRASLAVNGSNLVLTIKPSAMIIVVR